MTASSLLHLEPYGPLALQRLAAVIAAAKATDPLAPVTVVVPSAYAVSWIRRQLAERRGLVNARFMLLPWLAEYIGSTALARQGKTALSPLVEVATVRGLAGQITGGPLAPVAHHPRLHVSLRATFGDMAQFTEDDLSRLAACDPLRGQLVELYRRYRKRLSAHYDRENVVRAAAAAVAAGNAPSMRDVGFVVFYLADNLSPAEVDFVRALAQRRQAAAIFGLTGDREVDDVTRQRIATLEPALGPAQVRDPEPTDGAADHVVSACDAHEEVRWVVRDIVRRARDGLPLHRVAVLYRQREPYGYLIAGHLAMARVPVGGPDPASLNDTPTGRLLNLLLNIAESDLDRQTLMRWLAETPVRITGNTAFSQRHLARWDTLAREAGIVKGSDNWIKRLARYRLRLQQELQELEDQGASLSRIAGTRGRIASADQLSSFVEKLARDLLPPAEASWRRYAQWASGLLEEYCDLESVSKQGHRAGYEKVVALLDDLGELPESALPADLPALRALLQAGMDRSSGCAGPAGTGVFVASIGQARGMQFEAVYLVGMAEGAFPPAHSDDPLLPDKVRETLVAGGGLSPRRSRQVEERRDYLAALAAGRQRVLLYPRADSAASRGQYPSHWLLDQASSRAGRRVTSDEITRMEHQPWLSVIRSAEHAVSFVETLDAADSHDYDLASLARWRDSGRRLSGHFLAAPGGALDRALRFERMRWSTEFTEWDGRVSELAGRSARLGLPEQPVSPTRLERWASCPFRYFLADVLGVAGLERPEESFTLSALDRGSLLHGILERFMIEVQERHSLPPIGEPWAALHYDMLRAIADERCLEQEQAGTTGSRLAWEATKEEIRQDLIAFLDADSRWRAEQRAQPVWIERRFGFAGDGKGPEVVLPGGRKLRFRGIIDRVDLAAGGAAFVMDYKTGSSSSYAEIKPDDPTARGKRLQLPVYALAVRKGLEGVARVDACYWFVTERGGFQRKTITLAEAEEPFLRAVAIVAAGIREGVFPAVPGKRDRGSFVNCRYCDFDRVCPDNRDLLLERKRQDTRLAAFLDLLSSTTSEDSEGDE